jgi:hypothetical protein
MPVVVATAASLGQRETFEFHGQLDFAIRGGIGQLGPPQVDLHRLDTVGFSQPTVRIAGGKGHIVTGIGQHFSNHRRVERTGVGKPGATINDDAHADAGRFAAL